MSDRHMDAAPSLEVLSALVDGEANEAEVVRACHAWREDRQTREAWARYQLIGDVLKSDDLAGTTSGSDFLERFRARLSDEPVVLAPSVSIGRSVQADPDGMPAVSGSDITLQPLRRRTWTGPVAVAACFVAVVGVLVLQGRGDLGGLGGDGQLASAVAVPPVARSGGVDVSLASAAAPLEAAQEGSFTQVGRRGHAVWRDPQLDQALMSQQPEHSFASRGGAVRTVSFEAP